MSFDLSTIHLHAGFRTGSTLAWSSLRKKDETLAFYEPLHEQLDSLISGEDWKVDESISRELGSAENLNVFDCYDSLLNVMGGVRNFRKSFAYERYFLKEYESNKGLAHYLRSLELLARSHGERPVLKYVRSQGRIAWIKHNCGGVHFALVRGCFDQFRSYLWNADHGNLYFLAATCEIFAKNVSAFDAELAAKIVKIRAFSSTNAAEEQVYYQRVVASLSLQELYFIHAYLWKRQFRHALDAADAVFSIYAPADRLAAFGAVAEQHRFELDLSTARASRVTGPPFFDERFERIEALADYCLWDAGHIRPLKAGQDVRTFLDPALEAEAAAAERLSETGPFERYSPMELLAALTDGALDVTLPPDPCPSGLFGAVALMPPLLTVPHRLTGDDNNLLRIDARAMYVPAGAALRRDPVSRTLAIVSSQPEVSVVAFGPHWLLPPGVYEVALSYDAIPRPGANAAEASLEIVADYGNVKVMEPVDLPLRGPMIETRAFEANQPLPAFEVRVMATDVTIHVRSYTVRRLWDAHVGDRDSDAPSPDGEPTMP
jgi:hypothetical protein